MRVAVVAMACEFPGAGTPEDLWATALHGRRCFRTIPPERLATEDYPNVDSDGIYPIEAGLLEGYVFDRAKFRVPQSAFLRTDMAHWLALDVASRALAGLSSDSVEAERDNIAVIVANTLTGEFSRAQALRYRWPFVARALRTAALDSAIPAEQFDAYMAAAETAYKEPLPVPDEDSLAGGLSNTIAGRIANHHGLRGGAHTVDGACASSLVAVTSACERLAAGDVGSVLVGAVDLSLDPFELVGFARNGALAHTLMRVFDEDADGFWPGEGCGFLMLATESLVEKHAWPVLGWIRGAAMSTDGAGALTRPSTEGQTLAATRAWARAGLAPGEADYFEAHGTGTPTGDPIELAGLAALFGTHTPERPVPVGSIKANIGHTKAAAGMAGMLKALMICRERIIPPTTGCERPLAFLQGPAGLKIAIPSQARAVTHSGALTVGVNSFGFGGINCHVVLQGADASASASHRITAPPDESVLPGELFQVAAASAADLVVALRKLAARAVTLARDQLVDLAYEMDPGKAPAWRACVVAADPAGLAANASAAAASVEQACDAVRLIGANFSWSAPVPHLPRIAFLFSGQGSSLQLHPSRWAARFPWLAGYARQVDALRMGDLGDTAIVQPLLAELALAGIDTLSRFGIASDVVMGHSFGELPALHCAGRLTDDGLRTLAAQRGACMRDHAASGMMVALRATRREALSIAERFGLEVACENGPSSYVLSGAAHAVSNAVAVCQAEQMGPIILNSSRAFHSHAMEHARAAFAVHTHAVVWQPANRSVVSTISGRLMSSREPVAKLLADQLVRPVLFMHALETLDEPTLVIEVGSGNVLAGLAGERFPGQVLSIDVLGNSPLPLLAVVGAAWVSGTPIRRATLYEDRLLRPCSLSGDKGFLASPCGVKRDDRLPTQPAAHPVLVQARIPSPLPAAPGSASALATLKAVVAEQTGLPLDALDDTLRLLSDLHLNSIRARHVVAQCAQQLGITSLPFELARLSNARIDEAAAHLESLRTKIVHDHGVVQGVAPWIGLQTHSWEACLGPVAGPALPRTWRLVDPESLLNPSCHALLGTANVDAGCDVVLALPSGRDPKAAMTMLATVQQLASGPGNSGVLVLQAAQSANAFMRSAALDLPDRRFCVVEYEELDAAALTLALAEFASLRSGYSELRIRGKHCERRTLHATMVDVNRPSGDLAPGSLLVVTGGASGIGRASAAAMARAFGWRLALIGRSAPGLETAQSALEQLRAEGCEVQYFQADLSLPDQAAAVAASIARTMGPVHAVLHAAGINHPVDVTRLAEGDLAATIACKVTSLRNLLAHLGAQPLQLVLGFGSIIGELGLAGEAHYALANEWLGLFMQEFAGARPDCRTQLISWSAWGQTGMAARLEGVVDGLALQDSRAIDTDEGIAMLQQIVAGHCAPSLICSGRHGRRVSGAEQRMVQASRYLERLLVLYPKVELIADATISTDSDLYLPDHAPQGIILFPMACAVEAMLAAASVLTDSKQLLVLRNFSVGEGISLAAGQRIVVRTCALVRNDGTVEVQLRADTTGYEFVHFSGVFSAPAALAVPVPLSAPFAQTGTAPERGPLASSSDLLYRGLCFHGPRFQQLGDVVSLSATECRVWTGGKGEASWYSPFLAAGHTGGAPYIRDSVMHALQLCVPHEVVLPVGVDDVHLCRFDPHQTYLIAARQRSCEGGRFVFDIDVFDQEEQLVECWRGLRLVCAPHAPTATRRPPIAPVLLESIAGRIAMDDLGAAPVQVRLYTGLARHAATAAARIDLAPSAAAERKQSLCTTHFDEYALVLASRAGRVTLDVQLDPRFDLAQWHLILGDARWQFSVTLAKKYNLAPDCAALCTWTLSECLIKLGIENWPFASAERTRRSTAAAGDMIHCSSTDAACVVMLVELAGKDAVAAMALAVAPSRGLRVNTGTQAQLIEEKV